MFGKKSWGGGALVISVSSLGALLTACLDRPLCAECRPDTTNQFVVRVPTNGVDKIDLLFMIDNSRSMTDKQALLSAAVPSLLSRFVNPLCLDENGKPNGGHLVEGRCAAGIAEFQPIGDIHIGVITSSLGIPGGGTQCPRSADSSPLSTDDRAWLLPKARANRSLSSWNDSGFLAWDPNGNKNTPPGTRSPQDLQRDFQNMVAATGETGCGFEASLESWYRFLIDPEPPETTRATAPGKFNSEAVGIDTNLLAQRAAFLRPDSLVAILMLTDENDCSLHIGAPTLAMQAPLPRATSACASNPDDPCCRTCGSNEGSPPTGCKPLSEDPECKKGEAPGWYSQTDGPTNLNCFDQKRRFGIDMLEPTEKYVRGLTSTEVPNRTGSMVPNPLFAARNGMPARDSSRVFLAGIVGVPWQDIATDDSRNGPGLRYMTAAELRAKGRWETILGNPKTRTPPSDPHMVESVAPRTGSHPLLSPAGTIASPDANGPRVDVISGHEQKSPSDLQYACIFELESPVDCNKEDNCDCENAQTQSPLCQPPGGGPAGKIQYFAKAYPGIRHLEVLKGIGDQAIVASICPKVTRAAAPNDDPNYGYNPAVTAIVDTLRPSLANQCLSRAPTVQDDGRTSCRVLETRFTNDCDCTKPGRAEPNADQVDSVRATLKNDKLCGTPETPACDSLCACEIREAEGDALTRCRSTVDASAQAPGYCYVDPQKGLGDAALVRGCPATQQRLLRLVGPGTPRTGSLTFMACIGQASSQ